MEVIFNPLIGRNTLLMANLYDQLVYIGIGSNLGDKLNLIQQSIQQMTEAGIQCIRLASIYESEPWGFESENTFFNTVLECDFKGESIQLMEVLQTIEKNMGRIKSQQNGYESRTIDLDILYFKGQQVNETNLQIPHPLFFQRKFVLLPWKELVENHQFSTIEKTLNDYLLLLNDDSKVLIVDKIQLIC